MDKDLHQINIINGDDFEKDFDYENEKSEQLSSIKEYSSIEFKFFGKQIQMCKVGDKSSELLIPFFLIILSFVYLIPQHQLVNQYFSKFTWNLYIHFQILIISNILFIIQILRTTLRDPGINIKNTIKNSHEQKDITNYINITQNRSDSLKITGDTAYLHQRQCHTCYLVRKPYASHCPGCKCCIDDFDHHCFVIGNCIGRRNHLDFIIFLFNAMLLTGNHIFCQLYLLLSVIFKVDSIDYLLNNQNGVLQQVAIQIVLIFPLSGLFMNSLGMLSQQSQWISVGLTSKTSIKVRRKDRVFSYENIQRFFTRDIPESRLNFW